MPYYSDELIEEVRQRNNIVDVISGYVKLQKKGSDYYGLCPFHNEKSPSFSVSAGKQLYYCFGCGAGGNVFTFLKEYENFDFYEAMEHLAERVGIELPKVELSKQAKEEADLRMRILEMNKAAAKYFYAGLRGEQGKVAMDYFARRELSKETMQKFGLGYAHKFRDTLYLYLRGQGYEDTLLKESGLVTIDEKRGGYDRFWNRVIFPIMDTNNRVVGFGGRLMGQGEPKYLNSPETKVFDKSRNLYGLNLAKTSRKPYILLCEGYMDVIALHQAGFDNAVASLGTAFTQGHASLLKRYTKEVYLTFDSDGAGVRAALRAIPILKDAGITAKIVHMEPYKDPDELIKEKGATAYQAQIEGAQNSFLFELSILEQNYNLKDPESKTAFYHEIARKILGFEEEMERNNYIDAVAEKYQTGYDNLRKLVYSMATKIGMDRTEKPLKAKMHDDRPWSMMSEKKKKEDGIKQSQKFLLTWLMEDPKLFALIKPYIGPDDFTEEIYRETARILFEEYERSHGDKEQNHGKDGNFMEAVPAKIVNMFKSAEQQREIAAVFHAKIGELRTKQDREKALADTIVRMKENSINSRMKNLEPTDMAGLQKLVADKQQLQTLHKLHISID
ncbi:DNA primase [Lachnospiraceae bacterium ZAX-1]